MLAIGIWEDKGSGVFTGSRPVSTDDPHDVAEFLEKEFFPTPDQILIVTNDVVTHHLTRGIHY